MDKNHIYHLNDRTMKYMSLAQSKRQHQYLGLPGEFLARLPQEVVFPNMDYGRADEFYLTDENMLINLEEESKGITIETLEKFAKYLIFGCYRYSDNICLAVLCHEDPKKEFECYQHSPSLFIKVHYYYFSQDDLWAKYENVIYKVKQNIKLTESEAMDIAFIAKFISKEYSAVILESLAHAFKNAIIDDKLLRIDVGVILGGMIIKHIKNLNKQNRLLGVIDMRHIEREIDKIVYDEYGDQLDAKDKMIESQANEIESQANEIASQANEIESQAQELETQSRMIKSKDEEINKLVDKNNQFKSKIDQLKEIGDFNAPEAKKIIQSLMLL